ncbi:methyltransferase [Streptomyces sp. 303MFCol5.2]|uniref:methyltransferase n=1 Tax=Streptomyces sp. 303MFCol5.2 TaxID=1172181 RepID=UPI00035DF47F|nr:methyltransferase [Streptomyces sp. 303MFCol5.2]
MSTTPLAPPSGSPTAAPAPAPTPIPLMELTTGFWRFKALAAAVDLGLFTTLSGLGSANAAELTAALHLDPRPARMLLASCASLGLLVRENDRYRNSETAEHFLVEGRPHWFGGFVRYSDRHAYPAWHDLQKALLTNRPTTWDPDTQESAFVTADPAILNDFWGAMFTLSSFTADALADAHDFTPHRRLLDVGGGTGAFPAGLCRRYPHLRATVLDLPRVTAMTREKMAGLGLEHAVSTHDGDFLAEPALPEGHDVFLLSMILHDWDEATGRALLTKCHAALPTGGTVIICELVLDNDETGPAPAALMGLNMLIETRSGHNYTHAEYTDWLTGAGFTDITTVPLVAAGANAAIVARKP